MEAFRPIRNDRLSDKVAERIIQLIRAGELPVGARLPNEGDLAQRLCVSRGVLREALTVLQVQGYISRTPREGTIIQRVNGQEMGAELSKRLRAAQYRELLEFREVMECRVVQNVIQLASDEELDRLQALADNAPGALLPKSPDYYFHYRLAELSGNSLFTVFIDMYYDMIQEMAVVSHQNKARLNGQQREHQRILDAIRQRSVSKAAAAVRTHLKNVQRAVETSEGEE